MCYHFRLQDEWGNNPANTWIGLYNDSPCTGCDLEERRTGWRWLDGSVYDHTFFHYWRNESDWEPSGRNQCVRMSIHEKDRGWLDEDCTDRHGHGYVCKKCM